jgi:polynucleotide 5'-kinase involved in rRNA processing
MVSPQRRAEIIDALRRGTVPQFGLDALAVGLERFESTLDEELTRVASGAGGLKAVRGEYGSGKTFFTRWLQERARSRGFASSEVQISETETPLHRMETVYRRLIERIST